MNFKFLGYTEDKVLSLKIELHFARLEKLRDWENLSKNPLDFIHYSTEFNHISAKVFAILAEKACGLERPEKEEP
jgi:hypothetical protein